MKITLDTDGMSPIGAGLALIFKSDATATIEPGYDEIYAEGGDFASYSKMTDEEKRLMKKWGWRYEEDMGWKHLT